jgi:hypothetical protein
MPTTNYDASLRSKQRRAIALVTFNNQAVTSVNNGTAIRREQPDTQLGEVLTYRHETKVNTDPSSTGATCGCTTTPAVNNPGGDNSNNVG